MNDGPEPIPDPVDIVAESDAAGMRTDRFLSDSMTRLASEGAGTAAAPERSLEATSRTRVKALILGGRVLRDGLTLRNPSEPVRPGTRFTVQLPVLVAARPLPQVIPFDILHEDSDLIVLDKPAGLVVHPAPGNEDGTLVNALLAHCGDELPGIGGERRPGIVHRLDKDTSGVMVVAKTDTALARLSAMFAARELDRNYLAIAWGVPSSSTGAVEGAIGRDPRDRKRMAIVTRGGKTALTHYSTLRAWTPTASLLSVVLATGRTHQIRVHLSSIGHPLVGDPVYLRRVPAVSRGVPPEVRGALLDFPRQALHAASLGFDHPRTGRRLRFETAVPADMAGLIATLG